MDYEIHESSHATRQRASRFMAETHPSLFPFQHDIKSMALA